MPNIRSEILIKKVFQSNFTWEDLEKYFNINQNLLKSDLENYLKQKPDSDKRLSKVLNRISENERKPKSVMDEVEIIWS